MTKRKDEPSNRPSIRFWQIMLIVGIFASSLYAAYSLGQRSQAPYISGMAGQIENWKMIYRAESAKQSVVMAFYDHITFDEFNEKFCLTNGGGVGANGEIQEITEKIDKYTHVFTDHRTGRAFRLRFENDKLMGYNSNYGLGQAKSAVASRRRN